jgi:hypothetical protein
MARTFVNITVYVHSSTITKEERKKQLFEKNKEKEGMYVE